MLKFAIILALVCVLFRWAFGQWPWQALRSTPSKRDTLAQARKLLRVGRGASKEDILAAHKQLIAIVHPDKGGSSAEVHEANDARDLLLDELNASGADLGTDGASQD